MSDSLARLNLVRPCTQRKVLCSGEPTRYWLLRRGLWSLGTPCPTYCFHMPEASGRVPLFGEIFDAKMWLLVTVIFCAWSVWPQADRRQIIGVIPPGIACLSMRLSQLSSSNTGLRELLWMARSPVLPVTAPCWVEGEMGHSEACACCHLDFAAVHSLLWFMYVPFPYYSHVGIEVCPREFSQNDIYDKQISLPTLIWLLFAL